MDELTRPVLVRLVKRIDVYDNRQVQVVMRNRDQFAKVGVLYDYLKHSAPESEVG